MRNSWSDEEALTEAPPPPERNPDSSRQSEYEDSVLPDIAWEHEADS